MGEKETSCAGDGTTSFVIGVGRLQHHGLEVGTGAGTVYAFVSARQQSREAGKTLTIIQEVLPILPESTQQLIGFSEDSWKPARCAFIDF